MASAGLLSVQMILIVVLFILSLAGFSFLVKQIFIDKQESFDLGVFERVALWVNPFNTSVVQYITFLGTHTFLIPANLVLTGYFLFIRKHKWHSIKVASIALSSAIVMLTLKYIFSRERPPVPLLEPALGYSFPSGHSMMSFAFYGLLLYLTAKYIRHRALRFVFSMVLLMLILLIGFSRIYLRVHYASDVLAGFAIGIVWLVFSLRILNNIEAFSKKKLKPVPEEESRKERSVA